MAKAFTKKLEAYPVHKVRQRIAYRRRISMGSSIGPIEVDYVPVEKCSKVKGHLHEKSNALCLVLEGSGAIMIGDKKIKIKKNDVINIPAGTWHEFYASKKEKLVFLSIQNPPIGDDYVFNRKLK